MKLVILAGGLGTRLSEETSIRPKPMVEIGGRPLLWHIMKLYSHYGIDDFIVCLGHKGYVIKEYFANYFLHTTDVTFDVRNNDMKILCRRSDPWRVSLIDTGKETMTGGRLRRVRDYVGNDTFALTYGDGIGDVDISALRRVHTDHGKLATLTAVQPPARFGRLQLGSSNTVTSFLEKPPENGDWINGGFFILNPGVFDLLGDDSCIWEGSPLETLARTGELHAHKHTGFWQPVDTLRDKLMLETLWRGGAPPWKVWSSS